MRYSGNDNYGRPKSDYLAKIAAMTDDELQHESYIMIYHSARCDNNPKADWHWMVDACFDEAHKRDGKGDIYKKAYDACYNDYAK
jgi:hypothetical protein